MTKKEDVKIKSITDEKENFDSSQNKSSRKPKKRSCLFVVLVLFFSFIIGGLGGLFFDNVLFDYVSRIPYVSENNLLQVREAEVIIQREEKITTTTEEEVRNLVREKKSAVVSVVKKSNTSADNVFVTPVSEGYGLILTADGLIVSADNIFTDSLDQYKIITDGGKEYNIKKTTKDPLGEIIFIKIDAKNLPVAELGSTDGLEVGQRLYTVFSNTLGKDEVTSMMLENKEYNPTFPLDSDRTEYYLQGEVADKPFGSTLFTISGKAAGLIVLGRANDKLIYQADDIKLAFQEVVAEEEISQNLIGIRYLKLNKKLAQTNDLSVSEGILLYAPAAKKAVKEASSAKKAGLQAGDIIYNIDGEKVDDAYSLSREVKGWDEGQSVTLKYLRDGKQKTTQLYLNKTKTND